EVGQVGAHGRIEVERALLHQPHHGGAGEGLGGRADAEEGVAVDRRGVVDVGDAVALDVLAAVGQDTDGHAGAAVPGHASLDLRVEFTKARVGHLRGGAGG